MEKNYFQEKPQNAVQNKILEKNNIYRDICELSMTWLVLQLPPRKIAPQP